MKMKLIPNVDISDAKQRVPCDEIAVPLRRLITNRGWELLAEHYPDVKRVWILAFESDAHAWSAHNFEKRCKQRGRYYRALKKMFETAESAGLLKKFGKKLVIHSHTGPVYRRFGERRRECIINEILLRNWLMSLTDLAKLADDVEAQRALLIEALTAGEALRYLGTANEYEYAMIYMSASPFGRAARAAEVIDWDGIFNYFGDRIILKGASVDCELENGGRIITAAHLHKYLRRRVKRNGKTKLGRRPGRSSVAAVAAEWRKLLNSANSSNL